jgi:acyl-coenzyme A synthetase/AMP-(fatty) acid ligase
VSAIFAGTGFDANLAARGDDGAAITYRELGQDAAAIARALGPRCLVFILCRNAIGSLAGYVACLNHGIVPLLLDADLDPGLLAELRAVYRPKYLWAPLDKKAGLAGCQTVFEKHNYALLATGQSDGYALHPELALLLTTSGSTGSPKLVRQSAKNILANARAIVQYLGLDHNERPITTLPMHYTYGLSIINSHLLVGATILLTGRTLVDRIFWQFFREREATSFGGVPYTYEMLKKMRFFRMALPSLKTMTQAGGKLTPELTREFAEFAQQKGLRFFVMYGQTEATARMSFLAPEQAVAKCGSIGFPIPGGEFYLVDEAGRTIAEAEQTGELVYKGPNVTLGYAECGADLAKGDEWGGTLLTGDMAKRDAAGYYYITGRKKRFIKLYGNRLNLDEIERLLKTLVTDCACAGRDDHLKIFIIEPGREKEIKEFIAAKTGINPAAFAVAVIAAIPKNESGKTIYTKLEL